MTTFSLGNSGRFVAAVGILIALIIANWYRVDAKSEVDLLEGGKASFRRGGTFGQDVFDLNYINGKWVFARANPIEAGTLLVPFEGPYNDTKNLRLDADGRVYIIDHESSTQTELRVVNGQWSYDASDHWQSIFDLD